MTPGNTGVGITSPQAPLHVLTAPKPLCVLYLTNDIIRIDCARPLPNHWVRFWHRALLGWRWERLP